MRSLVFHTRQVGFNEVAPKYRATSLAAKVELDFVDDTGRRGGDLYDTGKLAKLEDYLSRRGVTLKVGDEFVPHGMPGGFSRDGSTLV